MNPINTDNSGLGLHLVIHRIVEIGIQDSQKHGFKVLGNLDYLFANLNKIVDSVEKGHYVVFYWKCLLAQHWLLFLGETDSTA